MPLNVLPSTPQGAPTKPPKIRPSHASRWRLLVLLLVHVVIAAHIAHWLTNGRTVTPVEPSEAAAFAQQGIVNAGLIFFAATILLTAVFGRFFCGWACHVLALQDACAWLLGKLGRRPKPLRSRLLRYVPLIIALQVFIWPLVYRLWIERGLPPLHLELTTSDFWATFPGWIIGSLTFLICGGVIVYFLGAKGFCTYACPYGAFFAAADRLSPMRIRVTDACQSCGHCTAVCTSNVRVHEEVRDFGMVVDDGCMKCLDCVSVCPNDALYYGSGPLPGKAARQARRWARPDLSWPEEMVLALAFVVAFLTVRGLYGAVPLLMGLGSAAVMAYFALLGFQLMTRPHLKLKGWRLKRHGKLLPGGRVLSVVLLVFALLWGHSAVMRYHGWVGTRAYLAARPLQAPVLNPTAPPADLPVLRSAQTEHFERGVQHLDRLLQRGLVTPAGADAQRAWLEALLGRWDDMEGSAERAIIRGDLPGEMYLLKARHARIRNDADAAVQHFRSAAEAEPYDVQGYLGMGLVEAQRGDLNAASQAFEDGLRQLPDSATLAYNAAVARATSGDLQGAAPFFEHTVALQPGNLAARENLAGLLAGLGRLEESAGHYRELLRLRPQAREVWMDYLAVLQRLGRSDLIEQAEEETQRLGIFLGQDPALVE